MIILTYDNEYPLWMKMFAEKRHPEAEVIMLDDLTVSEPSFLRKEIRNKKPELVYTDLFFPIINHRGTEYEDFPGGLVVALWCKQMNTKCFIVTDEDHHSEKANPWCMIQRAAGLEEFIDNVHKYKILKRDLEKGHKYDDLPF